MITNKTKTINLISLLGSHSGLLKVVNKKTALIFKCNSISLDPANHGCKTEKQIRKGVSQLKSQQKRRARILTELH